MSKLVNMAMAALFLYVAPSAAQQTEKMPNLSVNELLQRYNHVDVTTVRSNMGITGFVVNITNDGDRRDIGLEFLICDERTREKILEARKGYELDLNVAANAVHGTKPFAHYDGEKILKFDLDMDGYADIVEDTSEWEPIKFAFTVWKYTPECAMYIF